MPSQCFPETMRPYGRLPPRRRRFRCACKDGQNISIARRNVGAILLARRWAMALITIAADGGRASVWRKRAWAGRRRQGPEYRAGRGAAIKPRGNGAKGLISSSASSRAARRRRRSAGNLPGVREARSSASVSTNSPYYGFQDVVRAVLSNCRKEFPIGSVQGNSAARNR